MDKRGKIWLLSAIFAVLLIIMFLFLSAVPTSNTKEYDSINKVVTIKSSSGEVISDITLNTPQVFNVMRGKDRKVAEFTIDNKLSPQQISSGLEKLDFYDVNDGMKRFDRQFTYKYKNSLGFRTVNDYETVCVDGEKTSNGTILQDCSQVLTGTHQGEVFDWVDLISLGEIPSGKTTIGIFTDVYPNERIEWIPTLFGVEVNEWAEWTESLNVGLVSYYKLDENATDTTVEDSHGANTGTSSTNTNNLYDASGKINSAFDFDGSSEDIDLNTKTLLGGASAISISTWVYHDTASGTDIILASWGSPNFVVMLRIDGTALTFHTKTSSGVAGGTTQTLSTTGAWIHIVGIYNGTIMKTYVNNVLSGTTFAQTGTITATGTDNYTVASYNNGVGFWDGKIDEVGIWNRSLNSSEISDLYNGGAGITYTNVFADWNITFNLTDVDTGEQLDLDNPNDDYALSCDNGFNVTEIDDNTYTATNFGHGVVECTFSGATIGGGSFEYFDKTQSITADGNKTVEIQMSPSKGLTQEEHDWLEAVYECIINGNGCA